MNKLAIVTLAFVASLSAACAGEEPDEDFDSQSGGVSGNGAPSGAHEQLNIIGVPKTKTADMTGNNGSRIFMPLYGKSSIYLQEGPFGVIDANGTDDGKAIFQLPNPDPDNDGITTYSVYARALGTPGGSSSTTTCATEVATGDRICSVTPLYVRRSSKGKSMFDNVSSELLYIWYDLDGDGTLEHYNLFNDALQDYFWQYDNKGMKVLQLRFYEMSTDVN